MKYDLEERCAKFGENVIYFVKMQERMILLKHLLIN
jgi:hypothetical protein